MTTEEKVTDVLIFQLGLKKADLTPEARLSEDLGCDSLDCIEIMMQVEDEMDIEIDEEDLVNIKTVKDLVDFINKKQADKDAATLASKPPHGFDDDPSES